MAKAKPKETSVPLIFALVFFILTTIAFGVMWYLAYSDQEKYIADAKKAKDDLAVPRKQSAENEVKAQVYRLYMGFGDENDRKTIDTERTGQNAAVVAAELDKINAEMAKKIAGDGNLPEGFDFWKTDSSKKAEAPPAEGLLDKFASLKNRDSAYEAAKEERDSYKREIAEMKKAATALAAVEKKFQAEINRLPAEFKADLKKVTDGFDDRTKQYVEREAAANKTISGLSDEKDNLQGQLRKLKDQVANLQQDNQLLQEQVRSARGGGKDQFTYDEPQGKVLRKLPEGVVEINLGSAANVRPGLTFTVLPPDFPEKGRQSRMRMLRVPDGKGGYKSVESFVPKGAIEIYEVVGPNLSLARIQSGSELDPIRDGVAVGDLIYNSAWRKGVADHIALMGIFDVNGDGTDDIESVVRDLTRMGIPVDAYYDLKKRAWVGQVTERTRFIVEGYLPINSATDPNRDEKTKLLGQISTAVNEGKQKGVDVVNFRDFFSRMGYKFRLDVTDDKINQATAPYLSNVGVGNPIPMAPGNP